MAKMKSYWLCTKCGEQVDDNFAACWNCQHDREGSFRPALIEGVEIDDLPERQLLVEKQKVKNCTHCQTALTHVGAQRFHEGTQWGFVFGDFGELLGNRVELEMFLCLNCRRVEFFYFAS